MEVQVDHAAVVSADGAAAARLGHEDPLDLLEPARDSLSDAALAPPSDSSLARAVPMKHDEAVVATVAQRRCALRLGRTAAPFEKRYRRFGWHEHMFATESDGGAP